MPPYTCVLPRGNRPPSCLPRVPTAFVSCSTVPWRVSSGVSYFFFGGFGFTSRAPICRCRHRPRLIFPPRRFVEEFNDRDFLQKKVRRAIIVGFFNNQFFVGRTVKLRVVDYQPVRGVRMTGGDEQDSKRVLLYALEKTDRNSPTSPCFFACPAQPCSLAQFPRFPHLPTAEICSNAILNLGRKQIRVAGSWLGARLLHRRG